VKTVKYNNTAYMFHANCVCGLQNKISLLKNCGGWYLNNIPKLSSLEKWKINARDIIVNASVEDGSDSMVDYPIGVSYKYIDNQNKDIIENKDIENKEKHQELVLCAIDTTTDFKRRGLCEINRYNILGTLEKNGIYNEILEPETYFKNLSKYKFIISPEGNGIDCYRHYEALIAGCIPIVEYSKHISDLYGNCPILYTTDYSEVNQKYLEQKYEEMKGKIYDFSKLYLSYYTEEQQKIIINRSLTWCSRLCKKIIN